MYSGRATTFPAYEMDLLADGWRNPRILEADLDAGARIEIVPQRIANKIERKHGQHDRQGGKDYEMRRVKQVRAAIVQHRAPACRRWRHTQAEEAHGGFGQSLAE